MNGRTAGRAAARAWWVAACLAPVAAALAAPLGSAFTYQGQLKESGQRASGLYDLQVCLFDDPANPVPLSCIANIDDVPVEEGVFSVVLDFGTTPFAGEQRHLELRVRPGASSGAYTTLAPRQLIRPAPEALRAATSSAAPWSGLSGVPAGFADNVDDAGVGTVTSVATGTGLSGGPITGSGTIAIANGGVGSAQLAAGAVGQAQINTAQVQARIGGICAVGTYLRGINADGSVVCAEVTGVNAVTTVDDPPAPATAASNGTAIAVGADGLPLVAYREDSGGNAVLKVAKCSNPACTGVASFSVVDDPANVVGTSPDMAIGADGLPVISYFDFTAFSVKVAKCVNPACSGVSTLTTVDDQANNLTPFSTAIEIGADGNPVLAHFDDVTDALRVVKCANAACTASAAATVLDDPANALGQDADIAVPADGLPVVAYLDVTAGTLKAAKCQNPACTGMPIITVVDDPPNQICCSVAITIGGDGLPVIAYQDASANALKVARCANVACTGLATITTVDDTGSLLGAGTTITTGADGLPVIGYRDLSAQSIKVAKCTNAACSGASILGTVDDGPGNVGSGASIAIGTDGLPVLSYYDNGAFSLKVAKCGSRSCR